MAGIVNQPALADLARPQRKAAAISGQASTNTNFSVTHTDDTALATRASGGSQIGSTLSNKTIPTAGVIRVTILEAEFDETENTSAFRGAS